MTRSPSRKGEKKGVRLDELPELRNGDTIVGGNTVTYHEDGSATLEDSETWRVVPPEDEPAPTQKEVIEAVMGVEPRMKPRWATCCDWSVGAHYAVGTEDWKNSSLVPAHEPIIEEGPPLLNRDDVLAAIRGLWEPPKP